MTMDPENTQEDTLPGNAAPQSGRTMGMDGDLREDSHKRIGGDDSGFVPVVGRSGERRSQEKKTCRSGERRSQEKKTCRSGERRSRGNLGWYSRGYLPHCDTPGLIQHIDYHLADSLPDSVLERFRAEIWLLPMDEENRKVELRRKIAAHLDAGHGSCILREPAIAACVQDTWFRFDGERYHLLEWVVMPNHCHVLIEVFKKVPLWRIIASWKNYTARYINRYQNAREHGSPLRPEEEEAGRSGERRSQEKKTGRSGEWRSQPVWHRDYWDRYIRDDSHYERVKSYIALNPVKAGLVKKAENWPWSSAAMRKTVSEDG